MERLSVDLELIKEFERNLNPRCPESSSIPARVLGYGEISTVFEIQVEEYRDLAFKRLPIYQNQDEIEAYKAIFEEYSRVLEKEIGINIVPQGLITLISDNGRPLCYIVQKQLSPSAIGSQAIHLLPSDKVITLVRLVLKELQKVWDYNLRQERIQVGIDGQISNWAIDEFDSRSPRIDESVRLLYMDTSTPLFRVEGVEQINPELFLRSAASFLVWILSRFFLDDVINRYYDFHLVTTDLITNFYKEQLPQCIPDLIQAANNFFEEEAAHLGVACINEKDARSYYRQDALIWSIYLFSRKVDRFLRTRILRREYPYILPGKIKR